MAAALPPKIEPYEGSYDCLICFKSVRVAGAGEVLHCTACTANPFHRDCAGAAWASRCPQCDGTVAPWCRADAGPSLDPAPVDGACDLAEAVNGGALTLAITTTASSGAVDVTVVDDDGDELEQVREQRVCEEGTAGMAPAQENDVFDGAIAWGDPADRTPSSPAQEHACHTAADTMGTPKQRKRKRSPAEPRAPGSGPRAKKWPGNAAATEPNTQNTASVVMPPPRDTLGHDDRPEGATASSSASDVLSGEGNSTPATGAAVHVCGHCGKRFRSIGKLAQHERFHTRDALTFHCSFCPKTFRCQSKATVHERTHTGEKPYACSMCPRRFANNSHVPRHARTHTGEKPYACSMCPKRFSDKSDVAPHERTHTGEKPYACSMCPVRFAQKGDVARHERTHTGEKPYACSMCPRRFAQKGAVALHERTHTGHSATKPQ